jgi:metal-dependent amidase/aminoacylase/carboxypeptidase family protein
MSDKAQQANSILASLGTLLPDLESVYKDIHSHPELSMQEDRTAGIAADRLRAAGYEATTRVGQTGVVGLLRNRDETYATAKKAGTIADLLTNHNPRFAPVIHPTSEAGVQAMVVASQAWLSP